MHNKERRPPPSPGAAASRRGGMDEVCEQQGLAIARRGDRMEVEALTGGDTCLCYLSAKSGQVVTGDRVVFSRLPTEPGQGRIREVLPRGSLLTRHTGDGPKHLAANVDLMVLIVAPLPQSPPIFVDQCLVAARNLGIGTLIVMNKCDLPASAALGEWLAIYPPLDCPVLKLSCKSGTGLAFLRERLPGHTSIFVGQSGVGKSSLVGALLPGVQMRVGELTRGGELGAHTTTAAELYHFPGGGDLIDSPGIRYFEPWGLTRQDIERGFPEIIEVAVRCRYRDCCHRMEPDCAVAEAVRADTIAAHRLQSFHSLLP